MTFHPRLLDLLVPDVKVSFVAGREDAARDGPS